MQEVAAQGSTAAKEAETRPPTFHDATMLLQDFLRLSDQFARRLGSELNVNATDYRAMEHLLRAGPLAPGELARRLGITSAAVTTSVDRLVSRGHVTREPDPADRRRIRNQAKVSLAEMAAELKVTPVTVLRWEQGAFEPRRDRAIAYRDLLEALQDATAGTAA